MQDRTLDWEKNLIDKTNNIGIYHYSPGWVEQIAARHNGDGTAEYWHRLAYDHQYCLFREETDAPL